ncbi:primary replicative DNA helicase [Natranaerovirga hydrolytica]|uniref:Replicative DNA helicase n=1 Tax=Natranaerovirga hydrolytica TaxID=680378 RepID=A0A4R1N878_9FIRM|nr:replicative DNA helicase [Natranaerovirga hydrolytica]TCK99730.1 primary replicative DNA helicase [Natranaerovirga hydrolytica]
MEETVIKKILPHSIEAEQSVIGSMLLDQEAISVAMETVNGQDFYQKQLGLVFEAIVELYSNNKPVDLITLQDVLTQKGILEQIGGIKFLSELANAVPTSTNIKNYAKIVAEKSALRKLIRASEEIANDCYQNKDKLEVLLDEAEKKIFNLIQNRGSEEFSPIKSIILTTLEKIENAHKYQGQVTGISTGFNDLDYRTAGLQKSDLVLIAARPSMGKTAFALNVAQNAAIRNNIPTAIFSLEMSKDQLVNRLLCSESMIDAQKVRTGNLEESDWEKIAEGSSVLAKSPIYIDDTPGISVSEMRAKCRKLKLEKGLGLILIDYLQLMSGSGRSESRQQEISEISRSLKALAREMDAPVVALSQLSRACEARADHRPMLSDLRESGAIEQDADVVMFLYRDEYYHPDSEAKNQAELIVAKQRNGPTGTVNLVWLGEYTKFVNMEREI